MKRGDRQEARVVAGWDRMGGRGSMARLSGNGKRGAEEKQRGGSKVSPREGKRRGGRGNVGTGCVFSA